MSAFAVVYDRSHAPVDAGVLERVMARLNHRGPDGSDVWTEGNAALGHWHFWTTPEEVGERQPLALAGQPFRIVFDGRLDNRAELLSALDIDRTAGVLLSDAAIVLKAYDCWGENCFERFIGEFAVAILDEARRELLLARDALGDRTLFYAFHGTRLVAASEAWAVAGADGEAGELNQNVIADFFALRARENGETFFRNVVELPPARVMIVGPAGVSLRQYWKPNLSQRLRGKSDREYAEGFLPLLEEAVRCRLRTQFPPAALMSGGLDSTSVACLAARMIAPAPLTTLSYVFDELPDCDERRYIETVRAMYGVRSIYIPCDDLWPYRDLQAWPFNPNWPEGNLYRPVMEQTFQRAAQEGLRVLLTGMFGDEIYDGEEDWLADMLADGRLGEAARDLGLHLRYTGLGRTLKSAYLRRTAARAVEALPGGRRLLARRRAGGRAAPAWLTPFAASLLTTDAPDPDLARKSNLLGLSTAMVSTLGIWFTSRHGIELRHPYRDRRLVEYALSLPAHQLYNNGQYKHILRVAMRGILPEPIRLRHWPTTLLSLLARGVEREREFLRGTFEDPSAAWRAYVRPEWLLERWQIRVTRENDGPEAVVPWLCVSFDSWISRHRSRRE